jgi:hypothetical protein
MAYLELKGEGDQSMPLKRRTCRGVMGVASWGPRDMAKDGFPEAQSPAMKVTHPSEMTPETDATTCPGQNRRSGATSAVVEHRPTRTVEGMSGRPKSRSIRMTMTYHGIA